MRMMAKLNTIYLLQPIAYGLGSVISCLLCVLSLKIPDNTFMAHYWFWLRTDLLSTIIVSLLSVPLIEKRHRAGSQFIGGLEGIAIKSMSCMLSVILFIVLPGTHFQLSNSIDVLALLFVALLLTITSIPAGFIIGSVLKGFPKGG
jgi:hypothetical protein